MHGTFSPMDEALESRLALLFATMEAVKATQREQNEAKKLKSRHFWWQYEPQNETTNEQKYDLQS